MNITPNIIIVTSVKILILDKTSSKIRFIKLEGLTLLDSFQLGETKYSQKHNNDSFTYTIINVEDNVSLYELNASGNINKTSKKTKEIIEITEKIFFKASINTQIRDIYKASKLFGFDNIEGLIIEDLESNVSTMNCILGPTGCGKKLFINNLEMKYTNKKFLYIEAKELIRNNEKYINKLENDIRTWGDELILCFIDADHASHDSYNVRHLCTVLKELKIDEKMTFKFLMTCCDLSMIHSDIVSLCTVLSVCGLSDSDKSQLLTTLLVNHRLNGEYIGKFATMLQGYTPRHITRLVDTIPTNASVTMDQLIMLKEDFTNSVTGLNECRATFERLRWDEIGGYEKVKREMIERIVEPLARGRTIATGILLHGPPGCSKTMFARAIATECGLNLFIVVPSTVLRSHVGESEANLRRIIAKAVASQPSMIFIDEIDGILPRKGRGDSTVTDNMLNELLTFMDGADKRDDRRVIVMAATNHVECLDEALTRSGRMDIRIEVGLPDVASITAILGIIFADQGITVDREVIDRIPEVATSLVGRCGADIVNVGTRAKKLCRRQSPPGTIKPALTMAHVYQILED